jgi:hypothetical protein
MDTIDVVFDSNENSWCDCKGRDKVRCYGNRRDAVNLGQSFARRSRNVQLRIHNEQGRVESVLAYETAPAG